MNARELKPCPFCQEDDDFGIGRGAEDREGFPTYIYCGECGAQGPWFYTRDKANFTSTLMCAENSGWNTRAALPEQPHESELRELLREAIVALECEDENRDSPMQRMHRELIDRIRKHLGGDSDE